MVPSDTELVRAAQKGDAASLGLLLERHRAPLYAQALRLLGRGPEAQDAVQDTFLLTLRSIDQLRDPQAVGGWLRAILRNVCLRELRRRRETTLFGEPTSRLEQEPTNLSVEESVDRLALRDWVWTALSELPEALRVTAMLRYFGSYTSYEEISVILGVPVGTVKSRLNQVRIKLADALLKAAGLAQDEARRITESQRRFFTEAHAEYNRGEGYEMFAGAFSDDLLLSYPDGSVGCGLGSLVQVWEEDLEAGVKMPLTNVLASKDVTVVEADFENPHDDPSHCPPATSIVYFYHDHQIHRARQYYAPRPEEKEWHAAEYGR